MLMFTVAQDRGNDPRHATAGGQMTIGHGTHQSLSAATINDVDAGYCQAFPEAPGRGHVNGVFPGSGGAEDGDAAEF